MNGIEDNVAITEAANPSTAQIDQLDSLEIVSLINQEDAQVAGAVRKELPNIARAVDVIVERLERGGRLFYFGAGTSGRLGVLDASEIPPTYDVPPTMVQGFIAGGDAALRHAVEAAEDDEVAGRGQVLEAGVTSADVVVGITASGRSPWVLGALTAARQQGAATVGIACNPDSPLVGAVDIAIVPVVGPEVIAGSSRMKAGTAQKMVLNMLSTASTIRVGKVFGNLMVDVAATNAKLQRRAEHILEQAAGVTRDQAAAALQKTGYRAKPALVMLLAGVGAAEAEALLARAGGRVRVALTCHSGTSDG